jgi:hypothetical protein
MNMHGIRKIVCPNQPQPHSYGRAYCINNTTVTDSGAAGTYVEVNHAGFDLELDGTSGSDFSVVTISAGPPKIMRLQYDGSAARTFSITLNGDGFVDNANRDMHFRVAVNGVETTTSHVHIHFQNANQDESFATDDILTLQPGDQVSLMFDCDTLNSSVVLSNFRITCISVT